MVMSHITAQRETGQTQGDTIAIVFSRLVAEAPEKTALISKGKAVSRGMLLHRARAIATRLDVDGVRKGDRLALWLPNTTDWVATFLAASMLGVTVVTLNTQYRASELTYILKHSKAVALITQRRSGSTDHEAILRDVSPELLVESVPLQSTSLPALKYVYYADMASDRWPAMEGEAASFNDPASAYQQDGHIPLVVLYTSGTTGSPKGVLQSDGSLLKHARLLASAFQYGESDRMLSITPFCGIYGLNALLSVLLCGGVAILPTDTSSEATLDLIASEKVTTISGTVDTVLRRWAAIQQLQPRDLSGLKNGIVPVAWLLGSPATELPVFEAVLGVRIVHAYGLSEGNSMIIVADPNASQTERIVVKGRPIDAEIEVSIRSIEDGKLLGTGHNKGNDDTGEICLRGPLCMIGYLDNAEASANAVDREGWLHTGDVGKQLDPGVFAYLGRSKEVIKSSGYTVSPAEIEHFLVKYPGVMSAQAVGITDADGKEWIAVGLIPSDGATLDEATLLQHCKREMAYYKVPRMIEIMQTFPTTKGANAEKVQRNVLASLLKDAWAERHAPKH